MALLGLEVVVRGKYIWLGVLRPVFLAILFLFFGMMSSCGEVTFFFSWNTGAGTFNEGLTAGIIVVGESSDEEPESVRISEGRIPRGMDLRADGTVQGIPEENGFFEFTVELTFSDGHLEAQDFTLNLE